MLMEHFIHKIIHYFVNIVAHSYRQNIDQFLYFTFEQIG